MSAAASLLLDRLGRPGGLRLGTGSSGPAPHLPTGIAALDAVLNGGLPRGRITELSGRRSAGRTGLACAVAARATRAGETIAWIDPEDALEPEAAAEAGVVLARTLWVRPRDVADALRAAEILLGAGGFGLAVLDLGQPAGRTTAWPRLLHAAERTRSVLLVVAAEREVGAAATLALEVTGRRVRWSGGPGRLVLLDGIEARVAVVRNRLGRPAQAVIVRQACA
jgi:hypothetical protein